MSAKARTKSDKVALVLLLCALIELGGLIAFVGVAWWQTKDLKFVPMITEDLKVLSYAWGTSNANITLTVKNVGIVSLSVSEVRVNNTVVDTVAYGGNFTGTTHTLVAGDYGTITITYPFSSGLKYEFDVFTAQGNRYPYTAIVP